MVMYETVKQGGYTCRPAPAPEVILTMAYDGGIIIVLTTNGTVNDIIYIFLL